MTRKAKSTVGLVSLGTFAEHDARSIADMLTTRESIKATVAQLFVGARDDDPTEWWHVYVPSKSVQAASLWLRGYRAGYEYHLIDSFRLNQGITYAEAAKLLGYGLRSDVPPGTTQTSQRAGN